MSLMTLGYATRTLPLGDDPTAIDSSMYDFAPELETPTFSATPVTNQDLAAPDIPWPTYTFGPAVGPAAPGEIPDFSQLYGGQNALSPDISQLILSGQLPPPSGSGLSASDISRLASAGATSTDIAAILQGQATPSNILTELAQATQLATKTAQAVLTLPSTPTGKAPTSTTVPIGYTYNANGQLVPITASPGTVTSALSSVESWFSQPSIIPNLSNGVASLLALGAIAAVGAFAGGGRRR